MVSGSCWQVEVGLWMSLVDTWWGARAERYHRPEFVFCIFSETLTLLKLLFYESVVEGRYFAPSPFGRILVSFQVAKLAPVGLHVKIVLHFSLPIAESVHARVAHFILSVHMHFGQRQWLILRLDRTNSSLGMRCRGRSQEYCWKTPLGRSMTKAGLPFATSALS
jgi:hypothetical protein